MPQGVLRRVYRKAVCHTYLSVVQKRELALSAHVGGTALSHRGEECRRELIQMVGAIGKIPMSDPEQIARILRVALDGLRYRPEA